MDALHTLFGAMEQLLGQLEQTLGDEQALLSAGQVKAALLQRTTETKNELLTTLAHLNDRRVTLEQSLALAAPYAGQPVLHARWLEIGRQTQALREANIRNGLLLNLHMAHNQQTLDTLAEQQTQRRLYGPDGHASNAPLLGRKFSI